MGTLRAYIIFIVIGFALADFKRWKPSMNFEEPSNWNVGRVPCSKDNVVLPEGLAPIFVQTNMTVSEIVFPLNGEIVLGSYVSIGAPTPEQQEADSDCQGQDVQFTRTRPKSWFDPNNWCSSGDLEGHCKASQPVLLATEQVPCKSDGVAFPANRHFLVDLGSGVDLHMSDLMLAGQRYTTGEFGNFLSSQRGQDQFKRAEGEHPTTITIKAEPCDSSGCACGNDMGALAEMICKAYNNSCKEPLCTHPIEATGGCCGFCGALLELEHDPNDFRMDTFRGMVNNKYIRNSGDRVQSIVSRTSQDFIQVVLYDNEGGQLAMAAGDRLNQDLQQDDAIRQRYGIFSVYSYKSSKENEVKPQKHVALSGSQWSGVIIAIIIIFAIIGLIVFFVGYRRNRPPPKLELPASVVNRFRSLRRNNQPSELELAKREPSVAYNDIALGFDNPVYDTSNPLDANGLPTNGNVMKEPLPAVAQISVTDVGFDNPLYGQGPVQQDASGFEEYEDSSMDVTDDIEPCQGISNPLYSGIEEIEHQPSATPGAIATATATNGSAGHVNGTYLHLNPVFAPDGIEDESDI